jgi:hypothetical protein
MNDTVTLLSPIAMKWDIIQQKTFHFLVEHFKSNVSLTDWKPSSIRAGWRLWNFKVDQLWHSWKQLGRIYPCADCIHKNIPFVVTNRCESMRRYGNFSAKHSKVRLMWLLAWSAQGVMRATRWKGYSKQYQLYILERIEYSSLSKFFEVAILGRRLKLWIFSSLFPWKQDNDCWRSHFIRHFQWCSTVSNGIFHRVELNLFI